VLRVSSCAVVISLVTTYAFIGSLFRACEELCIVSEICDCGVFWNWTLGAVGNVTPPPPLAPPPIEPAPALSAPDKTDFALLTAPKTAATCVA
jgi:hypothetical protein